MNCTEKQELVKRPLIMEHTSHFNVSSSGKFKSEGKEERERGKGKG